MSRDAVEIVREIYAATARRDAATILALYDPEVELDSSRVHGALMGGGTYRGHEGLRSWSRDWHEAWETIEYECEELIDVGDQVIAVVNVRGRGQASGAHVEFRRHAGIFTVCEGRVVRLVWFPSRREALDALREQALTRPESPG